MRIAAIEAKLLERISELNLGFATVRSLNTREVSAMLQGSLPAVAVKPAALVLIESAPAKAQNIVSTVYAAEVVAHVFVVAESLAGQSEASRAAYELIDGLIEGVGGEKFKADGKSSLLTFLGFELAGASDSTVVYAVSFQCFTTFQRSL